MMTIKTTLPGGTWVEVSVSDSRTGIPEHKHDSIFDTFHTTKERGAGLGLSIARTIIETYEGKIWAENQAGGGAVFRFTLPLIQAPRSDGVPEQTLQLQGAGERKSEIWYEAEVLGPAAIPSAVAARLAVWEPVGFLRVCLLCPPNLR